jgi:hypothetical protein
MSWGCEWTVANKELHYCKLKQTKVLYFCIHKTTKQQRGITYNWKGAALNLGLQALCPGKGAMPSGFCCTL